MQKPVGIWGQIAQLWQRLGRSRRRTISHDEAASRSTQEVGRPTQLPPALYAQRERLYICALQLLDDPQAARQVVAEALRSAALAWAQLDERRLIAAPSAGQPGHSLVESELTAWLDRSVLRLALLRLRVTPQSVHPGDSLSVPAEDDTAPRGGPLDGIVSESASHSANDSVGQLERIGDALSTLPPEIRAVIALVIMQGRSLPMTADLLGISEEACAFFLSHGRKLLRRTLQRDLVAAEDILGAGSILLQPRELHDLHGSKKAAARA